MLESDTILLNTTLSLSFDVFYISPFCDIFVLCALPIFIQIIDEIMK